MDPNQSTRFGTPGDPGSHLQFQISLLRLMAQKTMAQKTMAQKTRNQERTGRNAAGPKAVSNVGSSIQVQELEQLQDSSYAKVQLRELATTRSRIG